MQIALYVCRPLNGKHKTNSLSVLCAFAVNINSACLNNFCLISIIVEALIKAGGEKMPYSFTLKT